MRARAATAAVAAILLAGVALAFAPAAGNGFVAYDDNLYVTENPVVQRGLTAEGLAWAVASTREASNWHPLTWASHMLDVELFGLRAGPHHLTSVLFHAANALLLFGWLLATTGSRVRSGLAAGLWALHPLRVESVAWIAERKDVLSTFFWLLALWAWLAWTRRPGPARYAAVVLCAALGLMSKPMVVTLPVVLLIVDAWPLRRYRPELGAARAVWERLREKLPLVGLSALVAGVTVLAQAEKALVGAAQLPLGPRIANAALAAAGYVRDFFWPAALAPLYPHPARQPEGISTSGVFLSVGALVLITALAFACRRTRPAVLAGWGWYLVALAPVIGIVQVGVQGSADRYTYLPGIGFSMALAWSIPSLRSRATAAIVAASCVLALAAFVGVTRSQVRLWRDTRTLFEHVVKVAPGWQSWEILGGEYARLGAKEEALRAFERSAAAAPADPSVQRNVAAARARLGDHAGAADTLERSLQAAPRELETWYALAVEYAWLERPDAVRALVPRLSAIDPDLAAALKARLSGP